MEQKFEDVLDNYYLVKKQIKEIDPTLKNVCKLSEESLSFAKVITEHKGQRVYLIRTPFRFNEKDEVSWASSVAVSSIDNFNREFLPLNDVLAGMFETKDGIKEINFSHFNNHYNIGYGTPSGTNKAVLPHFFELPVGDVVSLPVNYDKVLLKGEVFRPIIHSQIDKTPLFLDAIENCKHEYDKKIAEIYFNTRAINFFIGNRKQKNKITKLPSIFASVKYGVWIDKIVENNQWVYFKEHISKETVEFLEKMHLYEHYNLKTCKNKKSKEIVMKPNHQQKKDILLAYLTFGENLFYSIVSLNTGQAENYNKQAMETAEQCEAIYKSAQVLETMLKTQNKEKTIKPQEVKESN